MAFSLFAPARSTPTTSDAQPELPELAPPVEIWQDQRQVVVVADVPGATTDQVDIDLHRGVLRVSARAAIALPAGERLAGEVVPVIYRRSFALADDLDVQAVTASVKDGVLRIVLPRRPDTAPRRIPVAAA